MPTLNSKKKSVDLSVANDSLMMAVGSASLAGTVDCTSNKQLKNLSNQRQLAIIELPQDDGGEFRVRLGKLTKTEDAEWVAKSTTKLSLPDGKLAICGGTDYFNSASGDPEFSETVSLKAGEYCVTVYALLPSGLGTHLLEQQKGWSGFANYWKSTRGNARLPFWLWEIAESTDDNLDRVFTERELAKLEDLEEDEYEVVEWLIALAPWNEDCVQSSRSSSGALNFEIRLPELCPKGLRSTNEGEVGSSWDSQAGTVAQIPISSDLEASAEFFLPMIGALGKNDFTGAAAFFPDDCRIPALGALARIVGDTLDAYRGHTEEFDGDASKVVALGDPDEIAPIPRDLSDLDQDAADFFVTNLTKVEKRLDEESFAGILRSGFAIGPEEITCTIDLVLIKTESGPRVARVRLMK